MQESVASFDPMSDWSDEDIQRQKSDDLHGLLKGLADFSHHSSDLDFGECLDNFDRMVFNLLASVTAHDQRAIRAIIQDLARSDADVERLFSLVERRGSNHLFFSKQIVDDADAGWIPVLRERG